MKPGRFYLPVTLLVVVLGADIGLAQTKSRSIDQTNGNSPRIVQGGIYSNDDFRYATVADTKAKDDSPFTDESDSAPKPDDALKSIPGVSPGKSCYSDECVEFGTAACDDLSGCEDPCCAEKKCNVFGFTLGSWLDQGITFNQIGSRDRFNGPLAFNDRENEYQMNQFYLFAERKADNGGEGFAWGGRVDLLYGTDWRFVQSNGLETDWNSERFYGAALPQLYADFAWNDFSVRLGHYYTILGYETAMAPDNFFYSHSYAYMYGEPVTHTGALVTYKLTDRLKLIGGIERGWNNWIDNNKQGEFLGGATLNSADERTSLAFALSSGTWDDAGLYNRTMYSLVFSHTFCSGVKYVIAHDLGVDNEAGLRQQIVTAPTFRSHRSDGRWYAIDQYLTYDISPCWSMGLRFEWFRDADGTRVGGIGSPHGWELGPNIPGNQIGWLGDFYELTAGVHWTPRKNITFRPEIRWDWYNGPGDGQGRLPYTTGTRRDQFTLGADLIVKF
jgi:hypothetical protein